MTDSAALQRLREERFFDGWDGFVTQERVKASEVSIRRLIDGDSDCPRLEASRGNGSPGG